MPGNLQGGKGSFWGCLQEAAVSAAARGHWQLQCAARLHKGPVKALAAADPVLAGNRLAGWSAMLVPCPSGTNARWCWHNRGIPLLTYWQRWPAISSRSTGAVLRVVRPFEGGCEHCWSPFDSLRRRRRGSEACAPRCACFAIVFGSASSQLPVGCFRQVCVRGGEQHCILLCATPGPGVAGQAGP